MLPIDGNLYSCIGISECMHTHLYTVEFMQHRNVDIGYSSTFVKVLVHVQQRGEQCRIRTLDAHFCRYLIHTHLETCKIFRLSIIDRGLFIRVHRLLAAYCKGRGSVSRAQAVKEVDTAYRWCT